MGAGGRALQDAAGAGMDPWAPAPSRAFSAVSEALLRAAQACMPQAGRCRGNQYSSPRGPEPGQGVRPTSSDQHQVRPEGNPGHSLERQSRPGTRGEYSRAMSSCLRTVHAQPSTHPANRRHPIDIGWMDGRNDGWALGLPFIEYLLPAGLCMCLLPVS